MEYSRSYSNQIGSLSQNALGKLAYDMYNGSSVTIDCRGDSTYYGYNGVTQTQVSNPAPSILQNVLQAYYNNTNITVINNGVSGDGTQHRISTWDSDMQSSTGKIVIMNYGMNDVQGSGINTAIDAETYRQNLRSMIQTARRHGKVVVLETPNPALAASSVASGFAGFKSEGVKQFADVMRQVAEELNVPLIDNFQMIQRYLGQGTDIFAAIPDGVHPSQTLYTAKGMNMASIFINPGAPHVTKNVFYPVVGPVAKGTTGDAAQQTQGSRVGSFRATTGNLFIPIWVDEAGLDIFIATPVWSGGSSSCNVIVDTVTVGQNLNFYDANLGNPFAVDQEVMVIQNASPGFHLIELNNVQTANQIGAYYLVARPTRYKWSLNGSDTTAPTMVTKSLVLANTDITTAGAGLHSHTVVDVAMSRFLNQVDIEVTASFNSDEGFILFAHPMGNNSGYIPRGGLYIMLDSATGKLAVAEGGGGTAVSFVGYTVVGATALNGTSHTYRVTVSTSGAVTLYVDGTQVGTFTQTKPHIGGFLGFYKNTAGTTRVQSVYLN